MSVVEVRPLELDGVFELRPDRFFDDRGFFSEVWRDGWLCEAGVEVDFVQDNHSRSRRRGVLRGLHFQLAPAAQDKLVRVARGAVFDVAVDLRRSSSTFGKWTGVTLSAEEWNQLFIPKGFGHGFVTLEDDTDVIYKTSATYSPELDRCIRFDDPAIGIDWPVDGSELSVSDKDRAAPMLSEVQLAF
jgi:dTDP-4-dehydrorhamnose 3,5-epimerase